MNFINFKLAYRSLLRNKLYTFLSITGFAVGFAVCLIIGLYIYGETRMNTWMPDHDRLVRLYDSESNTTGLPFEAGEYLKNDIPEVEKSCGIQYFSGRYDIPVKSESGFSKSKGIINTSTDFFDIFPLKVITANPGGLLTESNGAVITKSIADVLFPGQNPLGQKINVLNSWDLPIIAVVEDFPLNSSIQADIFVPSSSPDFKMDSSCNDGKCYHIYSWFVLLKPMADKDNFAENMNRIIPKADFWIKTLAFQPIKDTYLSTRVKGIGDPGNPSLLIILGSFGILILLLSTFNFLTFYISTQYAKIKELGIKKINGASLHELLRYSITEVSLSVIISLAIALIIFSALLPVAGQVLDQPINTTWLGTPKFSGIVVLVVSILIFLNSLVPIYLITKFNFGNLISRTKPVSFKQTGRKIMTLTQFAVSMALIIITLSIFHQMNYVKHADLGFDKEHMVRLNFSWAFKSQNILREKLNQLPDVKKHTMSSGTPGRIHLKMGITEADETIMFNALHVDAGFLNTFEIDVIKGRDFAPTDNGTVCIINREALAQYGWDDIEGKRFDNGREGGFEIIGVCENFFVESFYNKISPVVIMLKDESDASNSLRYATVLFQPGNIGNQMKELETIWKSLVPDEPMNYDFYDESFNAMYKKEERLGKSIAIAAVIALILTGMGILGQAFQISLNRSKEIGIRKVNGATVGQVLAYLNKGYFPLLAIAFVVSAPVAHYLINEWLAGFAYKAAIGWGLFALAGILVAITVIATVTLQSWKAATRNPVEALRYE